MRPAEFLDEVDEHRWLAALEWHALRCAADPLTPPQLKAWRQWADDDENRRVYAACAQLYRDAQGLKDSPTVARIGTPFTLRNARSVWPSVRWTLAGTLLALCAASTVIVRPSVPSQTEPSARESRASESLVYRTAVRQTRRIRLGDGSTVILGARTVLEVTFTPQGRSLDLRRGEAWFDVVHRLHWPFVVTAGSEHIRDLGTAFVVDREHGRTEVTVTQGQVEVFPVAAHGPPPLGAVVLKPLRLRRGERFVYGAQIPGELGHVSPDLALGWTRGRLEFVDEPLAVVAENVSRYSRTPISVSPAAANLLLTTLVLSHHISAWISGLSHVLPVVTVRTRRSICVRLQASVKTRQLNDCHAS
jgi:transmembrane sensor